MHHTPQTAEQEAQRIRKAILQAASDDIDAMARLLASKPDRELLGETEFQIRDLCHQIGAKAVEAALQERKKAGYQGSSIACPTCQEPAAFKGYRPKGLVSVLGPVRFERAYYHCRHCDAGHFPGDKQLALSHPELTPGAEQLVSLAGCLDSFKEAAEKILPKLAGVRVAESTVERTTKATGERVGKLLDEGRTFGPAEEWNWHSDAEGKRCAYVSIDTTGVPQQGHRGTKAEGRLLWVAALHNPVPEPHQGAPAEWQARYLSRLSTLQDLGRPLRSQAAQVGWNKAERWIALTNGGDGLREFMRANFPVALSILDSYHPAEKLAGFAKLLYPTDPEGAQQLTGQWCHTMRHAGGSGVLKVLREIELKGRGRAVREAHRELVRYISNNLDRMDYPRYLSMGWQIGSGPAEPACKTVVGQRLNRPTMRWSQQGTDALCHLRALYKSESSQWNGFWSLSLD